MELKAHQIKRRKAVIRLVLISSILGLLYPVVAKEFNDIRALINGILIGFLGGILIAVFEFKIFNPQYRKLSFLTVIIFKTLLYFLTFLVLIIIVKGFIDSFFKDLGFWEYLNSQEFRNFIVNEDFDIILTYTLFFLVIVTFSIQMARKIGYSVLLDTITGKYHTPKEEERILMLLDLKSSTTIAEEFGDLKYHRFLNDFYYDITKCIFSAKGNIYRYVGDEIMVSWDNEKGLKNNNFLRTYYCVKYVMRQEHEKYMKKYGLIPEYITCFHSGKIIVGEIGEVKSQIVFSGETLSELQKLKKASTSFNKDLIISNSLIMQMDLSNESVEDLGYISTVDQSKQLKVYSINEAKLNSK